jgi:hypothetical protein
MDPVSLLENGKDVVLAHNEDSLASSLTSAPEYLPKRILSPGLHVEGKLDLSPLRGA